VGVSAVFFLYVHSSRWHRSVRPTVDPAVQIDKSIFSPGLILLPRYPVHSGCSFSFQRVKAFPQQIDGQMVEQGGELHLLIFPCCLAHTRQPVGHAFLALCWVRVRLVSVLLDQRPSLLTLRVRFPVLVRMIHRYYSAVRFLEGVHAGRTAMAFSHRPAAVFRSRCLRGLPVLVHEVSRRVWGL
jgi:hypothetical protein